MCGIVGYLDKRGQPAASTGRLVLSMLEALARRGPDGAGVALLGAPPADSDVAWTIRIAPGEDLICALARLEPLGQVEPPGPFVAPLSLQFRFHPAAGVTVD